MNRTFRIAGLVVAGVVVLGAMLFAGVTVAQAQEPAPTPPPGGWYGPRGGRMGGPGFMGAYHEQMHEAIAEALGMTEEEFEAERAAGKTLWQIAEEQGVSVDEVWAAMLEARAAVLQQLVEDGVITQEQADWMLSHMQGQSAPQGGPSGPGGMMGGRGGRGVRGGGFYGSCPRFNAAPNTGS